MKKILGVFLLVFVAGVFAVGVGGCNSYNRLVSDRQRVDQAWAQVETVYQRRADLIPNLVATVSGNANFESSTLKAVTEARASVGQVKLTAGQAPDSPEALQKFQTAQDSLGSALSRLLVVAERYPELKANQGFRDLQVQLEGTENRITVERQRFNEMVGVYNTRIQRFPTLLLARLFNFQPKAYFTSEAGAEKAPKVEFNFNSPAK